MLLHLLQLLSDKLAAAPDPWAWWCSCWLLHSMHHPELWMAHKLSFPESATGVAGTACSCAAHMAALKLPKEWQLCKAACCNLCNCRAFRSEHSLPPSDSDHRTLRYLLLCNHVIELVPWLLLVPRWWWWHKHCVKGGRRHRRMPLEPAGTLKMG